jgi:uncharacterized protein
MDALGFTAPPSLRGERRVRRHNLGESEVSGAADCALSREECLAYLPSARVGRLAISVEALPVIVPVNYLALFGSVWLRAAGESVLHRASVGSVVAFEVDGYDDVGSFGWSVLARGVAEEVDDPCELEMARERWVEAWPLGERADRFIVVPTTLLTGWRYPRRTPE